MVVFEIQAIGLFGIHSSVQEVDGLLISVQMVGIFCLDDQLSTEQHIADHERKPGSLDGDQHFSM